MSDGIDMSGPYYMAPEEMTDEQLLVAYRFHAEEETKCDLLQHALKILN